MKPVFYSCSTSSSSSSPPASSKSYQIPFCVQPYPVQQQLAAAIRAACESNNNNQESGVVAVLESPTGTGKSQALLCGVLSHIGNERLNRFLNKKEKERKLNQDSAKHEVDHDTNDDESIYVPLSLVSRIVKLENNNRNFNRHLISSSQKQQRRQRQENDEECDEDQDAEEDDEQNDAARSLLSRVQNIVHQDSKVNSRRTVSSLQDSSSAAFTPLDEALLLNPVDESSKNKSAKSSDSSSSAENSDDDAILDEGKNNNEEDEISGAFYDIFQKMSAQSHPKVIFTSRTHSQLAQIVDEVQKGPFRFNRNGAMNQHEKGNDDESEMESRHSLFGARYLHIASRQQLCINETIKKQSTSISGGGNDRLNEMCKEACTEYKNSSSSSAKSKNNNANPKHKPKSVTALLLEEKKKLMSSMNQQDFEDIGKNSTSCGCEYSDPSRIELLLRYMMIAPRSMQEVKDLGRELKACPYFATKYAIPFSQLLLMPYTYLVDEKMRRQTLDVDGLSGGVVFSEKIRRKDNSKTNKKGKASAFFATAATSSSSDSLLQDSIVVIDEAHNLAESAAAASTASVKLSSIDIAIRAVDLYSKKYESRFILTTKTRLRELKGVLEGWKKFVVAAVTTHSHDHTTSGGGAVLCQTSSLIQFTFDTDTDNTNYFSLVDFLDSSDAVTKIGWFGEKELLKELSSIPNVNSANVIIASPVKAMREIHRICELIARSPEKGTVVAVIKEDDMNQKTPSYILQVLGLSPAQAVEAVTKKAKATIMAGGTLQPFQLMKMELFPSYPSQLVSTDQFLLQRLQQQQQAQFASLPSLPPVIVETFNHVVNPNRFQLFPVFTQNNNNSSILLRFTKALLDTKKHEMLRSVAASILTLSKIVPRGLVIFLPSFSLEESLFEIFEKYEPGIKSQIEMNKKIFREDRSRIGNNNNNNELLFDLYAQHIEKMKKDFPDLPCKGAVLMSVMGGKLSEGINFCDDLGRCVVVVGLPYPNLGDPKLQLKLESLKASSTNMNNNENNVDWSKKYYDALCMRSVNQSIGRCIRHVNDYAVVVLLDDRFGDARIAKQLPKWMFPRIVFANDVAKSGGKSLEPDVVQGIQEFFKTVSSF